MGLFDKFFGKGINALVAEARCNPDAVILDVRTPEEYAGGHIEGAINVSPRPHRGGHGRIC